MAIATALGYGLGRWWGWSSAAGLVLGLAISIASTVVLLRGLMDEGLLDTPPRPHRRGLAGAARTWPPCSSC